MLFVNNLRDDEAKRWALVAMLAGCSAVGAVGVLELAAGKNIFVLIPPVVRERTVPPPMLDRRLIISTFPNSNVLGNYSLLLLGPALGALAMLRGRWRLLPFVASASAIFCLSFSGNRTGWAGAAFGGMVGIWLARLQEDEPVVTGQGALVCCRGFCQCTQRGKPIPHTTR